MAKTTTKAKNAAASATKPAAKPKGQMVASPAAAAEPDKAEAMARMAVRASINAAAVMVAYTKPLGEQDVGALAEVLQQDMQGMFKGDLHRAEAMLFGQAHALQAIFMNLARRSTAQEYMKHSETYLRLALKAQSQCRATLETLAAIKNPPVVFARQANINNGGQQQVNNGTVPQSAEDSRARAFSGAPAPAGIPESPRSELLEASDGQWLDNRAAGTASGADPHLAAVGAVNRAAHG
jgi:hypothetical protein